MFTFKHPKYYKELRKLRNKSDQVISCGIRRRPSSGRAPDPGPKLQASSSKPRYTPTGILMVSCKDPKPEMQAPSSKLQAQSDKLQASSRKRQAP